VTVISALLSRLEDPFNIFPLEAVSRQLEKLVDDTDERMAERAGWWGVSPKYRSVEDEHDLEVVWFLIGSVFVLGQTAITQTVSIVTRLRNLAGDPSWLPDGKAQIMLMNAIIHPATGLSKIALYDAVANYFKHHYEWPPTWIGAVRAQQRTIDMVLKLGLVPESEENLHVALRNLEMNVNGMSQMGRDIQEWRERLAESLREQLHNHELR
jgi:hypothetical protein